MKYLRRKFDTTLLLVVIVCPLASGQMAGYLAKTANPASADNVSVVQLIANPERYDGKHIQLIGFLRIEFEGTAIYLHREDYEQGIARNALWINIPTGHVKGAIRSGKRALCHLPWNVRRSTSRAYGIIQRRN